MTPPHWTAQDIAAWLRQVHGCEFTPHQLDAAAAVTGGLNTLVRAAAADLPLEREPADFHRLYATIAAGGDD